VWQTLVEKSREQKDGVGKCLADCLLSCLDSMARYFNRWAFIYVGTSCPHLFMLF
jgi:hypothetical protein